MQSDIHHSDHNGAREATESSQLATSLSARCRLARQRYARRSTKVLTSNLRYRHMFRIFDMFPLVCAFLQLAPLANAATDEEQNPAQPVNAVVE